MRKIIAFSLVLIAIALSSQLVHAQSTRGLERVADRASAAAEKQTNELANLKARGDKMIADRLASLQKLLTRVQNDKRLTDSDKTSFTTDINTTIASLNTLKAKIDADTDAATTRADVRSIVTNYRIYEIYEPKLILLIVINNLLTADTNLTTLNQKVRILLTQLNILDPNAKAALDDMSKQLTTINTLLTTDRSLLLNVTISTTDPKSIFTQVRKDLATVRADFAKIRADVAQVRNILDVNLKKGTVTVHPTESTESAK